MSSSSEAGHPRSRFSLEEDALLKRLVEELGTSSWQEIADFIPGRNKRQVRERWNKYLRPDLNHDTWTKEEEDLLLLKHNELGNQWKLIATCFKNRTDINVKSKFHKIERQLQKEKQKNKLCDSHFQFSSHSIPQSPVSMCSNDNVLTKSNLFQTSQDYVQDDAYFTNMGLIMNGEDPFDSFADFNWF